MSYVLPRSGVLGDLELVEVYEFYDAPRLFACRNITDQLFLAVWIDHDVQTETWLYVAISRRRFEEIRSGGIDLHDAFEDAETGFVFKVIVPRATGISRVESVAIDQIPEEWLPERQEKLDRKTLTLPPLDADAKRVAKQNRRDCVFLKLEPPTLARSVAPMRTAAPVLVALQECIDAIAQAETGRPTAKGIIKKEILQETELAISATGGGSFEFQFLAVSEPMLFPEDTLLTRSLDKLVRLLFVGGDASQLRELLVPMRSRAASRYRILLEKLSAAESPISMRWASPTPNRSGEISMTIHHINSALSAVNQVETEVAEKIDLVGPLFLADVRGRRFGIVDSSNQTTYTGRVSKTAEASLFSATMMQPYAAKIAVIREISSATGEETEKFELLELNEPPTEPQE